VLTTETVAVEIVQTLVGSIGLVASVPLTTALACLVATRGERPDRRAVAAAPPVERGWRQPAAEERFWSDPW
jgi:hypothetical protein